MIVKTAESFFKDLSKIKNITIFDEVEAIFDFAITCDSPESIPGFKAFDQFPGYGRITIGDYRIGIKFSSKTIIFYRVRHRSEIYKILP